MENGKQRLPCGSETRYEITTASCPLCNASKGQLHEYGCPVEACPQCGGFLIACNCKALGIIDGMRTASAIADYITDRAEIHRVMDRGSKYLDQTYYEEGVMLWIMRYHTEHNPEAREKMNGFMADMGFQAVGNHCTITAEHAAAFLDMSKEEAQEVLGILQTDSILPDWEKCDGPVQ